MKLILAWRLTFVACIILGELVSFNKVQAQDKVYQLNPWVDGSLILGSLIATRAGLQAQKNLPKLTVNEVMALNPNDVNPFDRRAIYQDVNKLDDALRTSDLLLNLTTASVLSLAFDKRGRKNGMEILVLFLEAHGMNAALQSWISYGTNRYRPVAYMTDAEISRRTDNRNKNSFYSGHAAATATTSFFVAKVWSDLHPELGKKKWLLFAAATIPPLVVGNFRIKGGKHFLSDILIGTAAGGAFGILVPHLHKIRDNRGLSFFPVINGGSPGMGLILRM